MKIKKGVSKNPLEIEDLEYDSYIKEALRLSIIAEYDAINLYEQLAERVKDAKAKKLFLDIAKEEKVHVGEFQELLEQLDNEQGESLEEGEEEAEELLKSQVFIPYNVTPPKGIALKRHPQGGRYIDTDVLTEEQRKAIKTDVIAPKHIWSRASERSRMKPIKEKIKELNNTILPNDGWWTPLPDDQGYIVGHGRVIKTILSRDMIPKGTKI